MKKTRQLLKKILFLLLCLVTCFSLASIGHAEKNSDDSICSSSIWPSAVSDLAVDPDLLQGELANGFRYTIKQNKEPKDRVAVFLYVQAGSLNETEDERGLAHFLEHMMFKGTENYPTGSLIEFFQSIGMNFGGDANAHTTFDKTVYNLILPTGSENDLNMGFSVMADFARRATLMEDQISQERGVILAEKRARDSAAYRTQVAGTGFSLRGTRLVDRMVIGIEKTIEQANRAALKSFYDHWYRPENMILIVVGDMQPKIAEGFIKKHFAPLKPFGAKPECPEFGKLANKGLNAFYHFEPELGKTNVSIESFWDLQRQNDSLQLERDQVIQSMGSMIMGYRLQRMEEDRDAPFVRASYSSGDVLERIGYSTISAQTDGGKWKESLQVIEKTLRQALQYGFTDQEVARTKKEILADLDARVLKVTSENSREIAQRILMHLANNRVYQSAEQEKSLFGPIVEQITTEQINREFREMWEHDSRLVSVTGDVQLGDNGPTLISEHYQQATKEPISGASHRPSDVFPYLPISSQSEISYKQEHYSEIDIERLVFANGLIVNLKKTDFEKNNVRINASFGAGVQSETAPGVAMLAEDTINISGSGRLPQSAIDAVIAGSSVDLRFHIGETAFTWSGSAVSKDFELLIQVLQTMLFDPGFRENQFAAVMKKAAMMYQKISHEIDGAMLLDVQPFLAGHNPHFGLPRWKDVAGLQYSTVEEWIRSFIQAKDLEISLVGDFDREEVIAILSKYFGGVSFQRMSNAEQPTVQFPIGKTLKVEVQTSIDKALIVVAWPTDDFWDIQRTRRLHILADIFEDRVRKVLRESLGFVYSPSVSSFTSRVHTGYGFLLLQVIAKPGDEDQIVREIMRISDQLNENGVSTDELVRAKRPMVTAITEHIRTNPYWLASVLVLSSRYPQQLEWPKTILSDFSSIYEKDISGMARKYLINARAAIVRVVPNSTSNQKQ
jgi:zinc protease